MTPTPCPPSRCPRAAPWLAVFIAALVLLLPSVPAHAQGIDPENRPIAAVRVRGLSDVSERLVRNQIRAAPGDPYDSAVVQDDIVRITHLGRFSKVRAAIHPNDDGSVDLIYRVTEQPLIQAVQITGNRAIENNDLLARVLLRAGDPVDPFLIDRGRQQIIRAYADEGYFVADVSVNQDLLQNRQVLRYEVREGPKVRIQAFEFEGNTSFPDKQLRHEVQSATYIPIIRSGALSREQLEIDAARVRDFYTRRGYLDAQVGRRIDLAPNQRDAVVTFLIDQGPQYTVNRVRVSGAELFPDAQVRLAMPLKPGSVYSSENRRASVDAVRALYGQLGYIESEVSINPLFDQDTNTVDLAVEITQGKPYTVGKVTVTGNNLTKGKVILRQARGMTPGRRFDRTGVDQSRQRLTDSSLFSQATVTILGDEDQPTRDVLIEVKEQNTGSISFGAGVSSDAGVIGAIDLSQRNFDITDVPESWGEFLTGRAFRGAGQQFNLSLQPGARTSRYSINFREPYLLETDYSLSTNAFYFNRRRTNYDESRFGGGFGLGHRFGDVWSAAVNFRGEAVDINSIERDAPVDVFAVEGDSVLTSVGLSATRSTVDSSIFPTRGSRFSASLERAGALGGDYDFTKVQAEYRKFWTIDEDFLGRKTVLSARGEVGYIFEENKAPVFERFYGGGHSSFRGFDYRGIGPRGIENDSGELGDDGVGGRFLVLTGLEYNMPLVSNYLRLVFFTDQGTLINDVGLRDWRVSVGTGLRIQVPFLGRAPFALDFAYPVVKEDTDETRIFSFDISLPFR